MMLAFIGCAAILTINALEGKDGSNRRKGAAVGMPSTISLFSWHTETYFLKKQ